MTFVHCDCLPLHSRCDPEKCSRVAKAMQHELVSGGQPPDSASYWAVETTLEMLRQGGQEGCSTCGIIYGGLKYPGTKLYFHLYNDSITEEEIIVLIRDGMRRVRIRTFGSPKFEFDLNFYASPTSGISKFPAFDLLFAIAYYYDAIHSAPIVKLAKSS
jgi:hypothetical protein